MDCKSCWNYVTISYPLSFKSALVRASLGSDVFAANKNAAYDLAYAVYGRFPVGPEIDSGKENTVGYYWHYHPYLKNSSHIFYL